MKNFVYVLLIMLIAFSGCNKDDDLIETNNYFKIGDLEYDLSAGLLENFGTESWYNGNLGKLLLYSKGLSLQIDEEDHYEFVGKGHAIYFVMFSTSENVLDNTDYLFTSTEPYSIGTFYEGGYTINFDTENWEHAEGDDIADGTVSISKDISEYSITINCISTTGKIITGYYKGILRYFE